MIKTNFLFFVSLKYFRNRRKNRRFTSSLLSVLGVAAGVMTLIVVLAIMNGFQSGFISSILNISSYHIRLSGIKLSGDSSDLQYSNIIKRIKQLKEVGAIMPFSESQAIVKGAYTEGVGCTVRGIPPDIMEKDRSFKSSMHVKYGVFSVLLPNTAVIGIELAKRIGVDVGDYIELTSISGDESLGLKPIKRKFIVSGLFKSGYYDFDLSWIFVSLETAGDFFWKGKDYPVTYGIKLHNRFKDAESIARIKNIIQGKNIEPVSWREYNRSFFDALLMEKIMMMLLLSLIFVVVGFNIYHSLRRMVYEKIEDLAILKAIGAAPLKLQYIFILEGSLIGFFGILGGVGLGLLISVNINEIFSVIESAVNSIIGIVQGLLLIFAGNGHFENFSVFSPMYFYLTKVPVEIKLNEVIAIAFFAVAACSAAAYFASLKISRIKPAEILRYR